MTVIEIDAINQHYDAENIRRQRSQHRRVNWVTASRLKAKKRAMLYKYAKTVSTAAEGCVTDEMSC